MKFSRPGQGGLVNRCFSYVQKLQPSDRFLIAIAILTLFISSVALGIIINKQLSVATPSENGSFIEGVIGTPRFVNPVLAVTRADRDLSALIYAGIARLDADGNIVPDIAESITISDDGLIYNVVLRGDVTFQDGTPLTADDIAFTIGRIQDPAIASPLRASWQGVNVEVLGEHELNFILPEAYSPFMENLTVGILPRHIWKDASNEEFPFSQHNSEPIGAGPYRVKGIVRDASGIPESYTLVPYQTYHGEQPKIQSVTLNFYPNEEKLIEAWNKHEIDSVAGLSSEAIGHLALSSENHVIVTTPLPRTFAVFFNQNKSAALRDDAARKALDIVIDREDLIATVLSGYGEPLHSPIPPGFGITIPNESTSSESLLDTARGILRDGGWKLNTNTEIWEKEIDGDTVPLSFSIATANTSVFTATAEYLRSKWSALGVGITVKQFEQSDLTQSIIRPRNYEALLFGTALGRALDYYPFWHSSQRNDPGLNVALYANITTDSILEKERTTTDDNERSDDLLHFAEEVKKETPAIFLYSPTFTYVLPRAVTGATLTKLAEPEERFANITHWYMETESVWPFFNN